MPRPLYMKQCPTCESKTTRDEIYDAYFCPKCDIWLEDKCEDPTCGFCFKRPDKPSEVKPNE